ncbi:MaoC/PaaZ C-terminal domain-containing protein [Microbulbifer sp. ALW1]|uniref:MaoC/PaaZ C-terminal domain-containing protein n=1 Tax=Microbulbifer sp. (strain ALW1) TaxID=1516059 RepID=UPI001357AF9E|nr:MaoC/PaaZ C-terminal domain-containing protein [Microbulbifer sp. ALW1]
MLRIATASGAAQKPMPLQIELDSRPAILPLYFRALTARKSGCPGPAQESVLASVSLCDQAIDPQHLNAYREVCGFAPGHQVPATYPFVLAMPLQLKLLVSEAFPFPVLGVVHTRNRIVQHRPILESERLDIRCELGAPVPVKRGYEFELVTRVHVGEALVWECISTLLSRVKHPDGKKARPPGEEKGANRSLNFNEDTAEKWLIPADTGRRYGRISGDRNPIHLSAPTAKIFGFPRAIAHGMWTKARCLAGLEQGTYAGKLPDQFTLDVKFIKPVFLPAEVHFQWAAGDDVTGFAVSSSAGKRVHLSGQIACG